MSFRLDFEARLKCGARKEHLRAMARHRFILLAISVFRAMESFRCILDLKCD
jgi:hypothetical protein